MANKKDSAGKRYPNHSSDATRQNLTKEMLTELEETFGMLADSNGKMSHQKLPLALKALGMTMHETGIDAGNFQSTEDLTIDKFLQIVHDCMKHPNWAANEMNESFALFDRDKNGYVEPSELHKVFTKINENLTDTELEDQLREFDIDGDLQMVIAEYYKMISTTRGSDFVFEET
mmetsp:Transcript_9789/g.16149  ORF Transcript_9789/g.16149 Transcript_9789/m.16149 type:complete len:175 (-) Transcript_9789:785-1309(-)|eukprot:CAMPEP_0174982486 /NCGR_PEP_ID=MMETSP0004_2-20121128/16538_1 /TAXON_ID=420556 /ORGANISM="Ochromonas sp., Strain CCMP1393" /LENGTH=174 /DNA_ID=CAMNT_0016234479 /DNA_START=91 /DNA_END=615 /DNA_ORIENTATION=-